jgi:CubicO group peptidase (beta-lactamase class C family)
LLIAWILALTGVGCNTNPVTEGNPAFPPFVYRNPYPWPISTPASQGMDTAKVSALLREIRTQTFLFSFLAVCNDSLVIEYYRAFVKETDFLIYSAAKSFTSALVGIAIDRGFIPSEEANVLGYFPDFDTTKIDTRKRGWTIEHFLTMKSGIDWNEAADHSTQFPNNSNWMNTILHLPLRYPPGVSFIYTTPNVHVLSGILTRASGMSTYDFAEKYLFTPLNISVQYWGTDPQGIYIGGTEMAFTPRDLARFGQLYLHDGLVDGRQIISSRWIRQTLIPRNESNSTWGALQSVNYGYLWWNNYDSRDSLFMAVGFAGQFIIVLPARNMVIVTTGNGNVTTSQASLNEDTILGIVARYFL